MNKGRTPIPKTQREISISQQEPYVPPAGAMGFSTVGNPNKSGELNRAEKTTFRGDNVKPFNIGIQDIDEAIMFYFQNIIKPFVIQNGERIEVPIIYGSPEKWKSYQIDGYYRDAQGRIMAPLIAFRRTNIEKIRTVGNKLDANNPNNFGIFQKKYSKQNEYSKFNILNNIVPEKTYYATIIPDYIDVTYECVIFTYYVEQLNKIIEAVQYASDSYWGDPSRFKFKTSVDSFSMITELSDNEERSVKSTFNLKIKGHITPDIPQKDLKAIKKFSNKNTLTFTLETVSGDIDRFNANVQQSTTQGGGLANIIDSPNIVNVSNTTIINNNANISDIALYLNTNNQVLSNNYINNTTVTFGYGWLVAPSPLPATSVENFVFFCNGQLIEKNAIISFTQSSNVSTLVVDSLELGFIFANTDEIIGIGKFDV